MVKLYYLLSFLIDGITVNRLPVVRSGEKKVWSLLLLWLYDALYFASVLPFVHCVGILLVARFLRHDRADRKSRATFRETLVTDRFQVCDKGLYRFFPFPSCSLNH